MKDIVNVSIAGIAFKLEEGAYTKLNGYLQQIRDSYGGSSDGAEILSDLEARIAEIILTRQNASVVVPLSLVESTLEQLGAPEDISDGVVGEAHGAAKESASSASTGQIPHRLYRNSDGAKLGGVCNGLATYFNVDPALVRLLFAIPLVLTVFFFIVGWDRAGNTMTGFMVGAFLLYFLLWIVIPKAKTPLQKIEMRGEKVTKDKLEQTFREEFETTRGNDPQNIELRARNARNASVFSELVSIIGKVLLFFVKAVVAIIGFAFIMAIIGILAALIAVIIHGSGVIHGITGTYPELLAVIVCLAVLIPLSLAVYGILKLLFGFNHNKPLVTTLMVVWILTLVFGTVIFIKDMDNIVIGDRVNIEWFVNGGRWGAGEPQERWEDDFVDMANLETFSQTRSLGREVRSSSWSPLTVAGDTLWVAPMDTLPAPDRFTVKIRRKQYSTPALAVRKFYRSDDRMDRSDEERYFDRILVQQELRGDTLFLRADLPELSGATRQWADVDIFLPGEKEVVVLGGMNYNEYYDQ